MGGSIWVESEVGKGTAFHFTIVTAEAPVVTSPAHRRGEQPQLAGRKLLIVDDNETNRRIVVQYARSWGMVAYDTGSPEEALAWIGRDEMLDLVILDAHMPDMDGLALAAEIRKCPGGVVLPLVMFSSIGRRETGPDGVGFAAHLTKPVKPSQLFDTLTVILLQQRVETRRTGVVRPQLDSGLAQRLPRRILLAEDNVVNQKLALRLLSQLGYRADVAANGLEAIAALGRQPYDIVLMDVQMPELDGLEATREICRRRPQTERPWIIAMTANAMQGDRELCLKAGMDDYISKPIRADELVGALSKSPTRV
jgi:CheY-like chemotaxis protein